MRCNSCDEPVYLDVAKSTDPSDRFINRELSWLAFNHRVLQEASRPDNPLIERVRFLGIFSNNMDEFFRVRVANLQRALLVEHRAKTTLGFDVKSTLNAVSKRVVELQGEYNRMFEEVEMQLGLEGIKILDESEFSSEQREFTTNFFKQQIRTHLVPIMITEDRPFPDLKDGVIYFVVGLKSDEEARMNYALIQIPPHLPRFVILPSEQGFRNVAFIDDVIRQELKRIFRLFQPDEVIAHAIKVTRDAEIDMDDDLKGSLMEKMSEGIAQRKKGDFVRMLYDREMPLSMLELVKDKLDLADSENIIPASRYHNRKDLMKFPNFGRDDLVFPQQPPLQHHRFRHKSSLIAEVLKRDVMLHFPYDHFGQLVDFMREAAIDPLVEEIHINLYRVAHNSKIINALVNAAYNGKKVHAVIELAARFDEKQNIRVSNQLQEAGIRVEFGVPGLKVHSKLFLVNRRVDGKRQRIAYVGTGNFHEDSAKVFCDFGLFTADPDITKDVASLFSFFSNNYERPVFKQLIVSPYSTRRKFTQLVRREMEAVERGRRGHLILKLNNLVDEQMIELLYQASRAGVKIDLIVRGICSLIPGVSGMSENIKVRSIVGRYLEHARVLYFANDGKPEYYISSADWMTRNLDRRVEVSVPIKDPILTSQLAVHLEEELKDNVRARRIGKDMKNDFESGRSKKQRLDSQVSCYARYAESSSSR